MKIKIIDKRGLPVSGKIIPEGETIDLESGPVLDAALRFKQAEPVAAPPAEKTDEPPAGKKPATKK
ncbi:MAG: hypothetical protein LBK99_00775 [Opitutaceae bacterium]|nr:hypothetical protein [Opitutaceae bacterium]